MRFAVALIAAALATSANATHVAYTTPIAFTGGAMAIDSNGVGFSTINGIIDVPKGKTLVYDLSIDSGAFAAANIGAVHTFFQGFVFPIAGRVDDDYAASGYCAFDGSSTSCFQDGDTFTPQQFSLPANLAISPQKISWTLSNPDDFDNCATSPSSGGCAVYNNHMSVFGDFTVQSSSPVNYSLKISQLHAVPEPASWMMMIAGFGLAGTAMRRRRPYATGLTEKAQSKRIRLLEACWSGHGSSHHQLQGPKSPACRRSS